MMEISTKDNIIIYNPRNTLEEIVANVGMILRVFKEEQPLNRGFSLNPDLIDKNINVVENKITAQLLKVFREYEPRAVLKQTKIEISEKNNAEFEITVRIEVIE